MILKFALSLSILTFGMAISVRGSEFQNGIKQVGSERSEGRSYPWDLEGMIAHGTEEHQSWDERMDALDAQIERLEKIADQYQDKANEIDLAAQPLALRDWAAYAKAVKEAEDYARQAIQTRKKITELKKEQEQIMRKHNEFHDRQQRLSHL